MGRLIDKTLRAQSQDDRRDAPTVLRQVKTLLDLFRLERFCYVTVTLLAFLLLMVTAVLLLVKNNYSLAIMTFGSSGVMGFTAGRLLRMYDDAVAIVFGHRSDQESKPAVPATSQQ